MPRPLKEPDSLGERLKKKREFLNLSIEQITEEIQAPRKYVSALEEDKYEVFSAKVYALGFLKKYLEATAADDKETFLKEFSNEWEVRMYRTRKEPVSLPENRQDPALVTPARLGLAAGALFLVVILGFFGMRLTKFLGTPALSIAEPADQMVLDRPLVRVLGKTEKESRLTVNGRELKIDEVGVFDEEVELAVGLNALEFVTENRFGKTNKEIRHIIVK